MKINQSNLNWKGSLTKGNKVSKIVLHHAEHPNCNVQDIHRWHLSNGWTGIGYHYFVRKDGSIWTGRPEDAMGAHCIPANKNSLGICAEGSFMRETMSVTQKQSIAWLISNIKSRYGNIPIYGHRELDATNCPGTNYPLNELKFTLETQNIPNNNNISIGSKIKIIGANYATGQSIPSWVKSNVYTISRIENNKALIKEITSWIYLKDLILAEKSFVIGAKIKITGTNYATGQSIPSWVKSNVYTISRIENNKALIKEITSWVYLKDLNLL